MPHLTIVIVDSAYEPKCNHEKINVCKKATDHPYKYLSMGEQKGDTLLDFEAWKYRIKAELADMIQSRLDMKFKLDGDICHIVKKGGYIAYENNIRYDTCRLCLGTVGKRDV